MEQHRRRIDEIDRQITDLLQQRAELARQIGELKSEQDRGIYDPAREAQVLRNLRQADGPLTPPQLEVIFGEIISACRALERTLAVAYLGPPYTFTHLAALRRFGSQVRLEPAPGIAEILHLVESGQCHLGVAPVENSTGGVVPETLDALLETPLQVCGEVHMPVHIALLARGPLEGVQVLYSHPQPLAQCRRWLREQLPQAEVRVLSSTAAAAEQAAQDPAGAALAPEPAAEAYGLQVLATSVEDVPTNRTRFFVLGPETARPSGRDKTSIVFSTPHRPGALYEAMGTFARHGLNLTLIQSRPWRGQPWQYVFFVDFEGHQEQEATEAALGELRTQCSLLKILGSYPAEEA